MPQHTNREIAFDPTLIVPGGCRKTRGLADAINAEALTALLNYRASLSPPGCRVYLKQTARIAAEALTANAFLAARIAANGFYVRRGDGNRSGHAADSRTRDHILNALEAASHSPFDIKPGVYIGKERAATTVRLRSDLARRLPSFGLAPVAERDGPAAPLDRVVLKDAEGRISSPSACDAPSLERQRACVLSVNEALASGSYLYRDHLRPPPILHRVLSDDFRGRGRWWGGWHQPLSREERFEHLRINGERVACVDLSACFLSIAYGLVGASLPEGDLYLIDGRQEGDDRPAIKDFVSAMLSGPVRNWPGTTFKASGGFGRVRIPGRCEMQFKGRHKPSALAAAIRAKHAPVADFLNGKRLHELMLAEGDVIAAAVISLGASGIPALPVHDALWVPSSGTEQAFEALVDAFRNRVGISPRVAIETGV